MITCPICHQSIPDNSTVCPACGAKIQASAPGSEGAASQLSQAQQPQAQQPQAQQPQAQQPQAQQPPYAQPTQPYGYPQQGQMPPPGYAHPQAGFMPPPGYPPQQPGYGPPPAYPPYAVNPEQPGELSPKKRNTVILLCFFFGMLGVHRFYLGKIGTGILMLLTLGGLGVWYIIDFFISIFGKYKDSKGRFVDKQYNLSMVIALIILFALIPIAIGILTLVAIPEYARHRQEAIFEDEDYYDIDQSAYNRVQDEDYDEIAEIAYYNILLAEEAYFAQYSKYTTDYDALIDEAALIEDPNVEYGKIELCKDDDGLPGIKFTVRHKQSPNYFDADTCSSEIVNIRSN